MSRRSLFLALAVGLAALGAVLAFTLPDSCVVPASFGGYQRLTADCDSRTFLRLVIAGTGVVAALGIAAFAMPRTD